MNFKVVEGKIKEDNLVFIKLIKGEGESRFLQKGKELYLEIFIGKEKLNKRKFILLARNIIQTSKKYKIRDVFINWKDVIDLKINEDENDLLETMVVNMGMAEYEFDRYKEKKREGFGNIYIKFDKLDSKTKKTIQKARIIFAEINKSRDLCNTPGGDMTPSILVSEIKKAISGTDIVMKVLEESQMKKLGMGGVLGVSRGSKEKPKFIILEYKNGGSKKPIVLAGKGVTYDTGGLNLKPEQGLKEMNLDMSGAGVVVHAMITAAKLKIKKNIVVLIPAVENMPSGESYRPGDVLKMMSGKTVDVINTDAEGRIILADALTYAEKYKPGLVVDVATLTGAALVAVGERASIILSKNDDLVKKTMELGEESGDYVWPLPLWDEYESEVKGIFGDISNLRTKGTSFGGSIAAGMFLYQFAKNFSKWIHIDMAPRMVATDDEFLSRGSSGAPIRLLVKMLEKN